MKISALISDYDGTLCPTSSQSFSNSLPEDLHNILLDISKIIPVCIVSSKDFYFLDSCVNFAVIISSIMGIETFLLPNGPRPHPEESDDLIELQNGIRDSNLLKYRIKQKEKLIENSSMIDDLSSVLSKKFNDIKIITKYTYKDKIIAGVYFDYRHLLN